MSYCIAIEAEVVVPVCPLKKGRCMWQHREDHTCRFTQAEMTVEQFAAHVGMKKYPSEEQVGKWLVRLRGELKDFVPYAAPQGSKATRTVNKGQ